MASHPMLGTKTDVNGDEFEYCMIHSSEARNSLEAFMNCEIEDNPECHPGRLACPAFVEYMTRVISEIDTRNYHAMIFPVEVENGVVVFDASPEHPDPTGLIDRRSYTQRYENDVAVGEPEPMFDNQNADGSFRFECTRCVSKDCRECSWTSKCVCNSAPDCSLYAPGERDNMEELWDEREETL